MRVLFTIVVGLLVAAPANADTLLLQDGRALVGPRVEEAPGGVTVHFEHGLVHVPAAHVLAHYDEGAPDEGIQRKAHLRHRRWRSRYVEEAGPFRFETTMSRSVFSLYRDRTLAFCRALRTELGVEEPEGASLKVCLYADQLSFQQIGGAGGGTLSYFRFVPPQELDAFDDPVRRGTCLRALQWATASYVLHLAFPDLPHTHPIQRALIDYYSAAEPLDGAPAAFRFGLPVGGHSEDLRHELAGKPEATASPLADETLEREPALAWAVVHLQMQDAARRAALFRRLRSIDSVDSPDSSALLGLEAPESRRALTQALTDHVGALQPTTLVDWIAAGRAAEQHDDVARARSLYAQALIVAPQDPEALRHVAGLGNDEAPGTAAASAWRAFLAVAPLDLEAREHLARCLEAQGLTKESERETKLVLEIRQALTRP